MGLLYVRVVQKNAKYPILAYYSRRAAVIENFLQPIDRPVAHVLFQKGDP